MPSVTGVDIHLITSTGDLLIHIHFYLLFETDEALLLLAVVALAGWLEGVQGLLIDVRFSLGY